MSLLCITMPLNAEQNSKEETAPTLEFLEFLGEWETEEGEWIDPVELEDDELGQLIETSNETDNEN